MPSSLVQTHVGRSGVSRDALRDASRTASSLEPRPKTRREPRPASHLSGPATRLRPVRSWFAPGNCPALETAGSLPRHLSGLGTRGVSPAETVHHSPRRVLEPKSATFTKLVSEAFETRNFASPVPLAGIVSEFCRVDVSTTLQCFNQALPNACSENY